MKKYPDRPFSRCRMCQYKILPDDIANLQTYLGMDIKIIAKESYVLQVKCGFCHYENLVQQKGLTETKYDEIIKQTMR